MAKAATRKSRGKAVPAPAPPNDVGLVQRAREGDEAAWGMLVERYQRLVMAIPRRLKLSEDDAADVFDGVFAELWRSLERLEQPERLNAWLATVSRRRSLTMLQHRQRWVRTPDTDAPWKGIVDPAPVADAALLSAEREEQMRGALERLPKRCRNVLELLYFSDPPLSYVEIAERLGSTPGSVGVMRARCLARLRREWATPPVAPGGKPTP